jgi:glycosyltransferase involved in cell wall biosynthesis
VQPGMLRVLSGNEVLVPSMTYIRRRVHAMVSFLNWWRIALLGAVLGAVILSQTVGPGVLWSIVVWALGVVILVTIGARVESNHEAISNVRLQGERSNTSPMPVLVDKTALDAAENRAALEEAACATFRLAGSQPDAASERPLISVVVPCFNDQRFLRDCLESIARQTISSWECIVVDDASNDGSGPLAVSFTDRDPRFRVITHGRNGGLSAARNTGLLAARGELVTFLDSDDLLMANSLEIRLEGMLQHWSDADVAGVFCGMVQAGESVTVDTMPHGQSWKPSGVRDFLSTRGECPFNAHAPLIRADLLIQIGGFDETLRSGAEDWDLWLRTMRHGYCFRPVSQIAAVYRQRSASMVKRMPDDHLAEARMLLASAHRPFDGEIRAAVPFVFDRSVGEHIADLDLFNRVLQFAGMVAVSDGLEPASKILRGLPAIPRYVVDRQGDTAQRVLDGIRRGLSVGPAAFKKLRPQYISLRDDVLQLADEVVKSQLPKVELTPRRHYDIAVIAESGGQVASLWDLAQDAKGEVTYLSAEHLSGAQGATDALTRLGVDVISLSAHQLNGATHGALLTARPHGAAIGHLVTETAAKGGRVLELANDAVDHLDDNTMHAAGGMSAAEVRAALSDRSNVAVTASARPYIASSQESISDAEEYPRLKFDGSRLAELKDMHAGETCVIVGNGPSLNELDLGLLADVPFFAVNGIFHAADRLPGPTPFYVVEDNAVAEENTEAINDHKAGLKFFPSRYRKLFGEGESTLYFRMNRGFYSANSPHHCIPRFSTDASQRVYCGQSVTIINLQLAYHFGFSRAVLIGMDFSYVIPTDADRKGDLITSRSDDPNHFHPDYFGKGKTWKDPKLERVLANYQLARTVYEADGRTIVNATPGGNLHVFDRADFAEIFGPGPGPGPGH